MSHSCSFTILNTEYLTFSSRDTLSLICFLSALDAAKYSSAISNIVSLCFLQMCPNSVFSLCERKSRVLVATHFVQPTQLVIKRKVIVRLRPKKFFILL